MLKIPDRAIAAFEHFTKTDVVAYIQDPLLNLAVRRKVHTKPNCCLAKRDTVEKCYNSKSAVLESSNGFSRSWAGTVCSAFSMRGAAARPPSCPATCRFTVHPSSTIPNSCADSLRR